MSNQALENDTGKLFGNLWGPYDEKLFAESVELFARRLDIKGFDRQWFKGKTVLDAGCGGGRNTIGMASLGAERAYGIDIGEKGIEDARMRAQKLDNIEFRTGSVLALPYEDAKFDMVWCAGVIMHTDNEERALDEVTRVLKKDGKLYLLVYATGGLRWPLIQVLRPIISVAGQPEVEAVMEEAGMQANKRRTFLDDLFVPKFDFFHWPRLERMLEARGYKNIDRWGADTRLDHEHSLKNYREDMESLLTIFDTGRVSKSVKNSATYEQCYKLVQTCIETILWYEGEVAANRITEQVAMQTVIGQGHHRVLATKG